MVRSGWKGVWVLLAVSAFGLSTVSAPRSWAAGPVAAREQGKGLATAADFLDTAFRQPALPAGAALARSAGQDRAVVLVHGLQAHPVHKIKVLRARLHSWQEPGSVLVTRLAREADVFAYAYSQNMAIDDVAARCDLPARLAALRRAGYREVVLVGHSAGGILVRQVVEDHPDLPVTRVIQVDAPNTGSAWARLKLVRSVERPFLRSLTWKVREKAAKDRAGKRIPAGVQFVCVVGTGGLLHSDGVVATGSQWPQDLQEQGVPAVGVATTHWSILRRSRGIEAIVPLVREPQPRWAAAAVAAARGRLGMAVAAK